MGPGHALPMMILRFILMKTENAFSSALAKHGYALSGPNTRRMSSLCDTDRTPGNRKFRDFTRKHLKGQKKYLAVLILILGLGIAITSSLPFLYGQLIDYITGYRKKDFYILFIIYFTVSLLSLSLSIIEKFYGEWVSFLFSFRLKRNLFDSIISLKCTEIESRESGEFVSRLNGDVEIITSFYINMLTSILTIIMNTTIALFFILGISNTLAGIALLFMPLSVLFNYYFKKKYKAIQECQRRFRDRFYSFQVQILSNIMAFRPFGIEAKYKDRFTEYMKEQWKITYREKQISSGSVLIGGIISNISSFTLLYCSAGLIWNQSFTLGSMAAFMSYISQLTREVNRILNLNMESQNVMVSIQRIQEMENLPSENYQFPAQSQLCHINEIKTKYLSFFYHPKRTILEDITMEISVPGLYTIVGKNGSGKSTLLKLLAGYYDSYTGQILIDGRDLQSIPLNELRESVKYISGLPYIENMSFYDNIRFFYEDIDDSRIRKTYQQAGLSDYIESLPDGYHTLVGANGITLSNGQRQKLNIARILVSEAPILLFDEITSELDGSSEAEINLILLELARSRIIIHATHRIASAQMGRQIFVMENGKIIIDGTHEYLLKYSDLYKNLFVQQNQEAAINCLSGKEVNHVRK